MRNRNSFFIYVKKKTVYVNSFRYFLLYKSKLGRLQGQLKFDIGKLYNRPTFEYKYINQVSMSKHSKNNTSSSVFTYAERQKLRNKYGTIQTRIGQDSIKKIQDCTICHTRLVEPTSCDHGHMFCRSCVISYIVQQKKKLQRQNSSNNQIKQKEEHKNRQKQLQKQVQNLQKFEKFDNFLSVTQRNHLFENDKTKNPQQKVYEKIDLKTNVKPTGIYQLNKQKDQYTKSSFWAIQNTPEFVEKVTKKDKQQKKTDCPGPGIKHKLTLKKLRDIKINELDNLFSCWVCSKEIGRQKVGSYKCGHLVCVNCKSQQCQICSVSQKWLQIEGNSSAFSSHNKSQVKTYTHAFLT